jgi:CHASE2 domain-containing sensor protein
MPEPTSFTSQLTRWRERLLDTAVLAVPLGVIARASDWIQSSYLEEPWKVLWISAPLVLCGWLSWRILYRSGPERFDWRYALFVSVYGSGFAVASATDPLAWRRVPVDVAAAGTHWWVLPVTLGDWRYWFAPPAPEQPKGPVVILLDRSANDSPAQLRLRDRRIVSLARAGGATGVAFDVTFDGPSLPQADLGLCKVVEESGLRVLSAHGYVRMNGVGYVITQAETQLPCFPVTNQGHAMGIAEVDGRVRTIPFYWRGFQSQPALSVRIAEAMLGAGASLPPPSSPPLRFLPRRKLADGRYEDVYSSEHLPLLEAAPAALRDRFVLVGDHSTSDTFRSPFGAVPGTVLHAFAVDSLLHSRFLTRAPGWLSTVVILVACYLLGVFASTGRSARSLLLMTAAISGAALVMAAAAVFFFSVWLEVIYVIAATWTLIPLLLLYRSLMSPQAARVEPLDSAG